MDTKTIIYAVLVLLALSLTARIADDYIAELQAEQLWAEKLDCHYAVADAIERKLPNVDFINDECQF